jgi:hypothetical protein
MIATVITMGTTARVLLSESALDATLRARLERAGYTVHVCLQPKRVSAEQALDVVTPLLQRDLFVGLS